MPKKSYEITATLIPSATPIRYHRVAMYNHWQLNLAVPFDRRNLYVRNNGLAHIRVDLFDYKCAKSEKFHVTPHSPSNADSISWNNMRDLQGFWYEGHNAGFQSGYLFLRVEMN